MSPHGLPPPPPRPRRGHDHQPSFSAALLDAIYHSLEADAADADDDGARSLPTEMPASPPRQRTPVSSRGRHRAAAPAAALSRSGSSARSPRLQMSPRPCRVRPHPQPTSSILLPPPPPPPPPYDSAGSLCRAEKKAIRRSKKKKKTKGSKVAAPFACILNAMLCNRKPTRPPARRAPLQDTTAAAMEPASARSILSSRASRRASAAGGPLTPARRAVRFAPVAVVVDDEHGRGVATTTRLRDADSDVEVVSAKQSATEAERTVEELLRALGVAEDRERERAHKESSESSSDLFELESLPPAFEDVELPRLRTAAAAAGIGMERPRPRV